MKHAPMINSVDKDMNELKQTKKKLQFKGPQHYRTPTELYGKQISKIIERLDSEGFYPCRCRYTVLKANGNTPFHRDYPEWLYGVRLHIPIITNAECFFEYEQGQAHVPADGSAYLVKINKTHRVYNNSSSDRVHFLCDFFDLNQKTKFNKFTEQDRDRVATLNL